MNKGKGVMGKTNTMLVDLTRPQPFQPKSGAKKLIIKNLRPAEASQKASEEYYRKTWNDLDSALKAVCKTPLSLFRYSGILANPDLC